MPNNNLANISIFENLQNQANRSMGFDSAMSVFNATFRVEDKKKAEANKQNVEDWKKKFIEDEQYLIKTKAEFKKKKAEFEKLEKVGQVPRKIMFDYTDIRTKRIYCRNRLEYAIREFGKWGIKVTSTELNDD
ncbi:MAG: hypothetical protein LBP87_06705 [Planctomycetaceae bacterium]|jgi:hypothetical protein|nr:hypothetical protein [Planctomycetaceae bacterium]